MDPRVVSKYYGRFFRQTISGEAITINDELELEQKLEDFFDEVED